MKLIQPNIDNILAKTRKELADFKLLDLQIRVFTRIIHNVLEDYRDCFSENAEVEISFRKVSGKIEAVLLIPGEKVDPFEEGKGAKERILLKKLSLLAYDPFTEINYLYARGINFVTVSAHKVELHLVKNPLVLSVILGFIMGLAFHLLPEDLSGVFIDNIVSPILNLILDGITAVMGPIIFLSLITSITAFDSINELNSNGIKLLRRFLRIANVGTIISIAIGILLFPVLGAGKGSFDLKSILGVVIAVIPTSLVTPFVDNNIPQLVILGVLMGAALLTIKNKVPALVENLEMVKKWLDEVLSLVLKLMPVVPFLSILKITATGKFDVFVRGWRYIVGTYLALIILLSVKLASVSIRCKVNPILLLKKCRPSFLLAFSMGSEVATFEKSIELSKDSFGIDPEFTSFWFPIGHALMRPVNGVGYVMASFMVAYITETPISMEFLLIMFLVTVQLSLASPGLFPGLTIMFEALGIPTSYVGLFPAYSVFLRNFCAGINITYRLLEETEAAFINKKIDMQRLKNQRCL